MAATHTAIVVSKRRRPLTRLVPIEPREHKPLRGSVSYTVDDHELLFSTGEPWDIDHE